MKKRKYIYAYDQNLKKIKKVKTRKQAYEIANINNPEYITQCPKCDCLFGVN